MDCMVDLETLDVRTLPCLLSLGAVLFEPQGNNLKGNIGWNPETQFMADQSAESDCFYSLIDAESCQQYGGTFSADTIAWWAAPERAPARRHAFKPKAKRAHIAQTLAEFTNWMSANEVEHIWGHGANFDVAIIQRYIELMKAGIEWPIHYQGVRDTRTLYAAAWGNDSALWPARLIDGAHHPVIDAYNQAALVQQANKLLHESAINAERDR